VAPAQPAPAHDYGAPGQTYGPRRRPGTVTAAAVLAFVDGGLGVLVSLLYLFVLVVLTVSHYSDKFPTILIAIFFAFWLLVLAHSALFIWGGVRALKGRKALLTVMSTIQVALTALGLFGNLATSDANVGLAVAQALVGLVFVAPILILLAQRSSKEFSRERRGAMP